jgi:hypothetical protein
MSATKNMAILIQETEETTRKKEEQTTLFSHHQSLILEAFLYSSPTQVRLNTCVIKEGSSLRLNQSLLAPGLFLVKDTFL